MRRTTVRLEEPMTQNDKQAAENEQNSEFLAKEHGQAWASFYDSFDKLVQENLTRSSELLRRAMTIPEVADREIAQVRDELTNRIAQQRATSKSVLSLLSDQVSGARNQVTNLAVALSHVTVELESIGSRVADALKALDVEDEPVRPGNPVSAAQVTSLFSAPVAPAPVAATPAIEPEPVTEEKPADIESAAAPVIEAESAAEMVETAAPESESAELAAETAPEAEADASATEPTDLAERRRPHWLSVPRSATR
jgi:hypothetical protein